MAATTKKRCPEVLHIAGSHNLETYEFHCFQAAGHSGQHVGECIMYGVANMHAYWPIPERGE